MEDLLKILLRTDSPAEIRWDEDREKVERLCLDFDEDCVLGGEPPFGSFRKCWDYDRSTGFCPFCLPRSGEPASEPQS